MSNPLKKTMVYLGLADEDLEYEEQHAAPAAAPAAVERAQRVRSDAPAADAGPEPRPGDPAAPPDRHQQAAPAELNEILTVHPSSTATPRSSPRASATASPSSSTSRR